MASACVATVNISAISAARMVCPLAFSTTDISNGNSGKNNAKYRSDVKRSAIGYGLSSKGVRYETIVSNRCSSVGDGWV